MSDRTCSVDGCGREHRGRGYCNAHYLRWRKTGDPLGSTRPTLADRFWAKVDRRGPYECWEWTASYDGKGYGQFRIANRSRRAHQVAYELLVGPVPEGLVIDHLCRDPRCANPAHMEPVTQGENVRRGDSGAHHRAKTHCPQGHPYDEANTYWHEGGRNCRACHRIGSRERRRRLRGAA